MPITKAKAGELGAVTSIPEHIKGGDFVPLFEVNENPTYGSAHLAEEISQTWGSQDRFLVDSQPLSVSLSAKIFRDLRAHQSLVTPAFGFKTAQPLKAALGRDSQLLTGGICIRFVAGETLVEDFQKRLFDTLRSFGMDLYQCDLVVDLGEVKSGSGPSLGLAQHAIRAIPNVDEWRSLSTAGSAFPKELGKHIEGRGTKRFRRHEWDLYQALRVADIPRVPSYGDFAVNHVSRDIAHHPPAPSIRYTTANEYVVFKASIRDPRSVSQALCTALISSGEFYGRDFSPGDDYIWRCSQGEVVGNPQHWRTAGTRHHYQVVIEALSSSLAV